MKTLILEFLTVSLILTGIPVGAVIAGAIVSKAPVIPTLVNLL